MSLLFFLIIFGAFQPVQSYNISYPFTTSENEISNLSVYSESYLFVDAFATWCESCKTEMEHLQRLYDAVGDQIQMISLSVEPEDTIKKINDFRDEFAAPWDFGHDHESIFVNQFPIINFPTAYFFDQEGNVLESWSGITSTSQFLKDMDPYIDVPEGYDESDDLDLYANEILTNPLFMITAGILIVILIYNFTKRKQKATTV
ncbi:MAG: TlpA family protein disulfide reductase [Candidatus Kariarchaeaceae archaeon]|jgi:thiol-disulfide isomerase/thioredoxin